jgi:hypothetical protein
MISNSSNNHLFDLARRQLNQSLRFNPGISGRVISPDRIQEHREKLEREDNTRRMPRSARQALTAYLESETARARSAYLDGLIRAVHRPDAPRPPTPEPATEPTVKIRRTRGKYA